MSYNARKLIETLTLSTKLLDDYLAEQVQMANDRKMLKYSAASSKDALSDLREDASVRLTVLKVLRDFETSRKNAEAALAKSEEQAKKDMNAISQGTSATAAAEMKLRTYCKDLIESLNSVRQKAKFASIDLANLQRTLTSESNAPRDATAKFASALRAEGEIVEDRLQTLNTNINTLTASVLDVN